ncbi:hypothetical protein ABT300_29830 [Streptomyces sp. NPDC001027]
MSFRPSRTAGTSGADPGPAADGNPRVTGAVPHGVGGRLARREYD